MKPYKVILADDERWIRSLLRSIVSWRKLGAEVVGEAGDGAMALSLCRLEKPHILVSDVRMPGLNGLELIEAVVSEMPEVQCIIISGYDEFEFARQGLRLGALDYLLKPLDSRQVELVVRRAIRRLRGLQEEKRERRDLLVKVSKLQTLLSDGASAEQVTGAHLPADAHGIPGVSLATDADHRILRALTYLDENLPRRPTLTEVAEACYLSPGYFCQRFKETLGIGFGRYVAELRLRRAEQLMANPDLKCREIAELLGFSSQSYFSRFFKLARGCTPEEYRRQIIH